MYNEAPRAGKKNVSAATAGWNAQDLTNELLLIPMMVSGIHSLWLFNSTCETFVLRKMVFDGDNLYSTIWLSLPHIGKAGIKTLPQQQQALSFIV